MRFPYGKTFAFTILDDTDDATVGNVKPVYDCLKENGFVTTKTVWPLDCPEGSRHFFAAETLHDKAYLAFVHDLVDDGFELALHGATMESSLRERTIRGLEFLKMEFGDYPRLFCNHGYNRENLYWGDKRFRTPALRALIRFIQRDVQGRYEGETEHSPYFWGDLCRRHITYVRNFTYSALNMLDVNPEMPYRLSDTTFVNYWFSTSDAPDVHAFNQILDPARIDKLERDGGICIVSTHLGKGFVKHNKLNEETAAILRYIGAKSGWFAPVSEILDYLLKQRGSDVVLSGRQRVVLESRFLLDQLAQRLSKVSVRSPYSLAWWHS